MRYAALVLAGFLMVDATNAYEEDANPLTLGPNNITDRQGNLIFTDENSPSESIPNGSEYIGAGFVGTGQTTFSSGLVNADFLQGPPDPNAPITDTNPLPGWSHTNVSGGNITLHWITDSNSPSGKAIRATLTGATSSDEVYLEQIVQVSPRQRLKLPILRSTVGADANSLSEVRIQYFTAAGVSTGSESTGVLDPAFLDPQDVYALAGIPSDARYARIRIAIAPDGAVTSDTIDWYEAWAGTPLISYETWTFSDTSLAGTGTNTITAVAGNSAGAIASNAEQYISPDAGQGTIGWVEAIGVKISGGLTAGTATFQLEGTSAVFGPIATIDTVGETFAWSTETLLDASSLLTPSDRYTVRNTGSGFTPTTADAFVHVRVAFAQLTTTTGSGS